MTFEDTLDQQKATVPTSLQILNQVELVEAAGAKLVKEVINQPITKG
jgi:hypothetical protein